MHPDHPRDETWPRETPAAEGIRKTRTAFAVARRGRTQRERASAATPLGTLGALIGDVSAHLATERAVTLFEPIRENDYVGYNGGIGSLGMDELVLDGYAIVDDAPAPTRDEDGEVCLHGDVQESDEQSGLRYCGDCGAQFTARTDAHAT